MIKPSPMETRIRQSQDTIMKYFTIILFLSFLKSIDSQAVPCSATQKQFFVDQGIDEDRTFCLDRGSTEPLLHIVIEGPTIHEAYQKCRTLGGFFRGTPLSDDTFTEYMNLMTR